MQEIGLGFIGAGGIARAHVYGLNSLKFYYDQVPDLNFESVTSFTKSSRDQFAKKYHFHRSEDIEVFKKNDHINAVFILGPNNVHCEHLKMALEMPSVKFIYLEKPVCASQEEEDEMWALLQTIDPQITIQVGFQYLQTASVREALKFHRSGALGKPIHFDLKYYHGDYLQSAYRAKRKTRLTPAPDGGAMADLGSHGVSLLMAFFGDDLQIMHALQGGSFKDVPEGSDLFSSIALVDPKTKTVGNLSASRISAGTGDLVLLEIFGDKGTLRYSSHHAGYFEYFLEKDRQWVRQEVGSKYEPLTSFPSGHVPPGWLRSMVHAHYVFLTNNDPEAYIPDLKHGLAVQRIVRETADYMRYFRVNLNKIEKMRNE